MWNSIKKETIDDLEKASHTKHLIITGISLGGALAALSYVDIAHSGIFDEIELITFGAPRTGNTAWANWLNEQVLGERYYIKNDPIASLPFCLTKLICNYKQVGIPYVCDKNLQECQKRPVEEEDAFDAKEAFYALKNEVEEHLLNDDEPDVQGLIDHITGYKNLKEYTQVD